MAPNTSSLYDKPSAADPSAENAVMVSKSSEATSAAAATPSATTMTSSSSVSTSAGVPSSSPSGRFVPSVLDGVAASLSARKSCLKRPMPVSPRLEAVDKPAAKPSSEEEDEEKPQARPAQKNRRRCWACRAKVGLTAVTCRCEYTFCSKHRYAEEHACAFNFKTAGKRKLAEDNPRVVPAKVARIN